MSGALWVNPASTQIRLSGLERKVEGGGRGNKGGERQGLKVGYVGT